MLAVIKRSEVMIQWNVEYLSLESTGGKKKDKKGKGKEDLER